MFFWFLLGLLLLLLASNSCSCYLLLKYQVHTEVKLSDSSVLRAFNTRESLSEHLTLTGEKFVLAFHLSRMVTFTLVMLRHDDTNPEAKKKEYIDHIEEIVRWIGWEPVKVTYASDYFQALYDLAVEFIKKGHAYVDHQTPNEIKELREKRMNSPWRDRPVEESLKLFDDMRRGLIEEGDATLRMKQNMQSDNGNIDIALIGLDRFEYYVREELNKTAPRLMVVLHPLKVVITNLGAGKVIYLDAKNRLDAKGDPTASYKVFNTPREAPFTVEELNVVRDKIATFLTDCRL